MTMMVLRRLTDCFLLSVFCLLMSLPLQADNLEQQRRLFQAAQADLAADQEDSAKQSLAALRHYPLYPWLEYELLLKHFSTTPDSVLADFTHRYPHSVMSDEIYARWAARLALRRDWHMVLHYIPANEQQTALQCYRAQALIEIGLVEAGLTEGKVIWHQATRDLPADCTGLIQQLRSHHSLSNDDYWQRIERLVEINQVTAARTLAQDLSPTENALVERWIEIRKNPEKELATLLQAEVLQDSAPVRQIIVFALKKIADKKLQAALPLWAQAQQKYKFTTAEKGEVESRFGMWEAWRHDPAGLVRLQAIPNEYRSSEGNIWLTRIALRTGHWEAVLQAASQLEKQDYEENDRDAWHYWQARALEQLGKKAEAAGLYKQLADDATFYGFLAADRVGQPYHRLQAAPPDRSQRLQGLQKLAAIQRWQEWNALGDVSQARREWFRLLQAMDTEGVQAAAELALRSNDPNLAIWSVSKIRDWNSVDLRFPVLYQDLVLEHSRSQGIQPAWILGIMRRESAFDAKAESSAKALGLMQLMPATARDVGRRLGIKIADREEILQPQTNVQLGSAYLRDMLKRFKGNYAQATAAYNAGPGRIPKWAPGITLDADQWVESIPFRETRQYVQAVMAYTTVYDYKLNDNKGVRLSERLQPIHPQ